MTGPAGLGDRMKLDDTTKIVSIVSVVVGLMLSVAGYFANRKLQSVQDNLSKLNVADKQMDVAKKTYDLSARLTMDFSLPLARSFALQYPPDEADAAQAVRNVSFPTNDIAREFARVLPGWRTRKGLMTGKACQSEGLKARQVVTLILKNIGNTDAVDVTIRAMQKKPGFDDPARSWQERSPTGAPLAYYELLSARDGWQSVDISLASLGGLGSPAGERVPQQVVLASVSGTTSLFGTVLVPVEVSWTDDVSKRRQTQPILRAHAAELRADLLGAEIGSLGSTCQ